MLLPSGNDAAYAIAAYVGRKSLDDSKVSKEAAIAEFVRLMNKEAKSLGAKNSCFKTPDGYDAIGQYTTAYDMGLIGVAAANNSTIVEVSSKSKSSNTYVSGEEITWKNTNKLINRDYGDLYYSNAIGLKTGTTTMAGRNIVAAGKRNGRTVVCVVMDSTLEGRWEDAISLLRYGLK
jgi:D-alanyl-D-alanine carboxypeptidase (penicillin-binding protein 5/6)